MPKAPLPWGNEAFEDLLVVGGSSCARLSREQAGQ
jgi:hypothetical protein